MKGRVWLKYVFAFALPWLSSLGANAQESRIFRPEHKDIRLAEDQLSHQHWELAKQSARYALPKLRNSADSGTANYMLVITALEQNKPYAADSATAFLSQTVNPAYTQRTSLSLAQYYFRKGAFDKAIPYYAAAGIRNLTNDEIADSRFELAYSYFTARRFKDATPLFASIRDVEGKYYAAGNYYYGLLAYNEGNYMEALNSFQLIENEKQYSNIIPYYIAEIYYFNGDRDKALQTAITLTKREEKLYYDKELYLLAAQVLFEEGRYGEALPFFENYYDRTEQIRKEELYEMAYSYYSVKEWAPAIEKFKQLSTTSDSLGQTAMYLLGDSYLRTGDKRSARSAFGIASGMDFNKGQQEAALLLYAKLSYEQGYDDDAVRSLTQLILDYPQSSFLSEAKTIFSSLLLKTRNYSGAYDLLSQASQRDAAWWKVHQKVTYGLATHYLQDGNLPAADSFYRESRMQATDEELKAASAFWMGEIAMRRDEDATNYFNEFIAYANQYPAKDVAGSGATLAGARLNMGYISMKASRYEDARAYFNKVVASSTTSNNTISSAARVREADALFMLRDFKGALTAYEGIIAANGKERDYAMLQRAIVLGALGKKSDKLAQLNTLMRKGDSSLYANNARYELALVQIEDDKYQQAVATLAPLTASGPLVQKAWVRTAFSHQQLNEDVKAIEAYKKAVIGYPASDERTSALNALKVLYIEQNDPAAYTAFLKGLDISSTDTSVSDDAYYQAAEVQFEKGAWAAAKQGFDAFIKANPENGLALQAHYYKGESHYNLKEYKEALLDYDEVLARPWNEFSEASARRASQIAEKDSNYSAALVYYNALRNNAMSQDNLQAAYSGLLRSSYAKEDFALAEHYADTLISLPNVESQAQREVQFYRARSLQRQGKNEEALTAYQAIKGLKGGLQAEHGYRIAEMQFALGNAKDAEASAAANLKTAAGNEYWVVKSYLLIADILVQQKDYFNAKATLQSVISNTKNVALKAEAKDKLANAQKLEKDSSKLIED